MVLAAEVISALGTIIIAFPYGSILTAAANSQLQSYPTASLVCWSLGYFLFSVYFNRHPKGGHSRHHHVISDIVAFPEVFKYLGYVLAVLVWLCILREKFITARTVKSPVLTTMKWVVAPIIVAAQILILTKVSRGLFTWPSTYLRTMGYVSILGSIIFSVGNLLIVTRKTSIDRDLFVFQTLGFLVYLVNTTLMYKIPDWYAVTTIAVLLFSNLGLLVSLLFTRKAHSYEQLRDDAIEMPELPTSRPRSRVTQEEF